jgi:hypothetical protein
VPISPGKFKLAGIGTGSNETTPKKSQKYQEAQAFLSFAESEITLADRSSSLRVQGIQAGRSPGLSAQGEKGDQASA